MRIRGSPEPKCRAMRAAFCVAEKTKSRLAAAVSSDIGPVRDLMSPSKQ